MWYNKGEKEKRQGESVEKSRISKAILGRLPQYLSYLQEIAGQDVANISATRIAKDLQLGEVQVRKDLNIVCGKGKPKLGYRTSDLIDSIETCLGQEKATQAVLVGAGRLGKALLEYDEFEKYGVRIAAAFDNNERPLRLHGNIEILPIAYLQSFCKTHDIRIGIITVGEGSAQTVCDMMLDCGIKAIWNFAPCRLQVPDNILFLQENLALSLAYLNNQLWDRQQKENGETYET